VAYGLEMETAMRTNLERIPSLPPRGKTRVVPSDVALERARQNQELAEIRYELAVRKGMAWNVDMRREQGSKK
jgi:hypothetical protein